MKKETWLKLAKALKKTMDFYDKLNEKTRNTYEAYNKNTDFLGYQYLDDDLSTAIIQALDNKYGDFEYLLYDCDFNVKTYCKNVTLKDKTHPKIKDLPDFYDKVISDKSVY